jgi:hypothetical protein
MSGQENSNCSEQYQALRNQIWQGRQANYENQDKAILSLASGALGVSLAFVKDIVPISQASWITLLVTSWGLFGVSIVVVLISFGLAQAAHDLQLELARKYYVERSIDEDGMSKNRYLSCTEWLNRSAVVCFLAGLVCTVVFASVNVIFASNVSSQKGMPMPSNVYERENAVNANPDVVKKGVNPPKIDPMPRVIIPAPPRTLPQPPANNPPVGPPTKK